MTSVAAARDGAVRTRTAPALLERLWRRRPAAAALVAAIGVVSGAGWAVALPRGPVDSWSGLALMATGAALGAIAGVVLRRRRAVLLVLLAHVAAFEVVRWPLNGPVVDGIRGTGTSYGSLDPTSTLTLDQAVSDTLELADRLRDRFDKERIYLVGNSYGTLLGVLAVQRRPDLFAAYVGTGQMVSPVETDRMFYADTLAWARRTGDDDLVRALVSNGPPPYDEVFPYEPALSHGHAWRDDPAFDSSSEMPATLVVEEYDLVQKVRGLPSFIDTFSVLYPQLQNVDFRTQARRLQVPVYLVEGEHEARGRVGPAREWFDALDAPAKRWIELPRSGHRPQFEQPALFAAEMRTVLLDTR